MGVPFSTLRAGADCFCSLPRDLRGPGLRAYFCHTAKVGKNALKPGGLRIP